MTAVWIDASAGASGDMLLGALVGAGVPLAVLQEAVNAVAPEPVALRAEEVRRGGLAATRVHVDAAESHHRRTWRDIRPLLDGVPLAVFERLAEAEAAVHGTTPDEVHFHEVGALDAIADVVGACAGFAHLGADRVTVSPVAVGSGSVETAHGTLPVPPPAVAELLRGVPTFAGAVALETCTPTGAALLTTLATAYGPQPAMVVDAVGVGAGGRDPAGHANVLRLFTGVSTGSTTEGGSTTGVSTSSTTEGGSTTGVSTSSTTGDSSTTGEPLLLECNVDDLDPRVWPAVIAALLEAGASDAWLTPILMKKGRPAHTLSALTDGSRAAAVRAAIFRNTSTIGLREQPLRKHALERELVSVDVGGQTVSVKLARHEGTVVNAQPEYDDVARAAVALGRPVADVLAEATALARKFL